eukprot:TRINITY_DN49342_c0_g1_i1.p2 TRINITY_DN49342_c0_g1~~TRINITY_DN49342_c0_g1_i1.p2  ORF type:complete len:262 (-),score=30.19 TRINITY_DN49342_c0_g1_i1:1529-2314(-)
MEALKLAKENDALYCTVGVHPTRCNEFDDEKTTPDDHLKALQEVVSSGKGKVVAIGECGLDYDRTQFCDKDVQQKYFEKQFQLAESSGLPMFLHNRNTSGDFAKLVRANRHRFTEAVAHSFTGSIDELKELLDLGLYIGINGCSLKTEENLQAMALIPLNRLLLETDAPWCDIRNTHASMKYVKTKFESVKKEKFQAGKMVKNRNEPCCMIQVAEVVAGYRDDVESVEQLVDIVHENTMKVFWPNSNTNDDTATKTTTAQA